MKKIFTVLLFMIGFTCFEAIAEWECTGNCVISSSNMITAYCVGTTKACKEVCERCEQHGTICQATGNGYAGCRISSRDELTLDALGVDKDTSIKGLIKSCESHSYLGSSTKIYRVANLGEYVCEQN